MRYLIIPILFGIFITSHSCNNDTEDLIEDLEFLDEDLEQVLNQASNGLGLDFFKLPQSDDFANIPQDPNNPITAEKVKLGQLLYHETGLAISPIKSNGKGSYSCASCHFASAGFQAGRHQGIGEGGVGIAQNGIGREAHGDYLVEELDVQPIRTPTAMNGAFQELMLWNGQFGGVGDNLGTEEKWKEDTPIATNSFGYHGLETQAFAGLKVHRLGVDSSVLSLGYKEMFDEAFPDIPTVVRYSREYTGLAIAAYERTLLANQAPFQRWLNGETDALSEEEKRGAILFFDKANCYTCHNGPALNTMEFHALGMKGLDEAVEPTFGTKPDAEANLGRGGFTGREEDMHKFKVPQLYNLTDSPFYGHGSSFRTVRDVVAYKNIAEAENASVPENQLAAGFQPLNLEEDEIDAITAFLERSLHDPNLERYEPASLLSGKCFPNNDPTSRQDLGCE